jgi:hypothetical protein
MRNSRLATCAFVIAALAPQSAFAWGAVAHQLITRRAIELLPPELKPFFEKFKEEIVLRVNDPDLWRNVGWEDDPNHFVDFGVPEYGPYPFLALPREHGAALEKFGETTLRRNGLLPWREAEEFGNLRRAFEDFKRDSPYTISDVTLFSAVAAHYLQDAYQPFHASDNYDGQQTGNYGIHARFERDLIERFESRLRLSPAVPKPMANPRDASFDALLSSYLLVDQILRADMEAIAGKDSYDDDYFETFFVKVKAMLEQRLSEAVTATASMIVGAWDQAGRPTVRLNDARPVQKVRPPR